MSKSKVCVLSDEVLIKLKQYGWVPYQRSLSIVILDIINRMENAENTINEMQMEYIDVVNQSRELTDHTIELLKRNGGVQ